MCCQSSEFGVAQARPALQAATGVLTGPTQAYGVRSGVAMKWPDVTLSGSLAMVRWASWPRALTVVGVHVCLHTRDVRRAAAGVAIGCPTRCGRGAAVSGCSASRGRVHGLRHHDEGSLWCLQDLVLPNCT